MPSGDVETLHKDGNWHNRIEGESGGGVFGTHATKEPAVTEGRAEAQSRKVEHIIRNLDGTIGERNSYGHDPRDVKG